MRSLCLVALLLTACKGTSPPAAENVGDSPLFAPSTDSGPQRAAAADVAFSAVRYAGLQLAPGATSTVEVDVVNHGQQGSGPFRVAVWASLGRVVTANKTLLGSTGVADVPNGGQVQVVIPITAPSQTGTYAIAIEVDDQKQVPGDDRSNNESGPEQLVVR